MLKNKIIIFADFKSYGGTKTFFDLLLKIIIKNFNVILVINNHFIDRDVVNYIKTFNMKVYIYPDFTYFSKIKFIRFFIRNYYLYLFPLRIFIREKCFNVIVSTAGYPYYLNLFRFPIKLKYFIHSYPEDFININTSKYLNNYINKNKNVYTVSNFSKNNIIRFWRISNKKTKYIKFIYNSVVDTYTASNKKHHDSINILTLGHLVDYKNPYIWLEVAREVRKQTKLEINFTWAGEGIEFDNLKALLNEDDSNIFLPGFISNTQSLYYETDIYFQPSIKESFGLATLEAMMMGIPCIVSNVGGLNEIVLNNVNGFICNPYNKNEFVKKIIELSEQSDLRLEMGKFSRQRYLNNFSFNNWKNKINNLISK